MVCYIWCSIKALREISKGIVNKIHIQHFKPIACLGSKARYSLFGQSSKKVTENFSEILPIKKTPNKKPPETPHPNLAPGELMLSHGNSLMCNTSLSYNIASTAGAYRMTKINCTTWTLYKESSYCLFWRPFCTATSFFVEMMRMKILFKSKRREVRTEASH